MSDKSNGPSLGDVVSAAGFVLGLVTAWLYFAGWSYAYNYFDRFRVPLLMVELPTEHIFVYGGLVVWKSWYLAVLVAILLVAIAWSCNHYSAKLRRFGLSAIVVGLVIAMFALARWGGVTTAHSDFLEQQSNDYAAYPRVRFALKEDTQSLGSQVVADLVTSDCGRLLLYHKDRLFLIRPVKSHPLDLDSFVLPWKQIEALRITSTYESCP